MTNTELVHRWFDQVWNQANEAVIDELLTPTSVIRGLGPVDIIGNAGFHQFYQAFRSAFPVVRVVIDDVLDTGSQAALRARARVTDQSGREFKFTGTAIVRIENGQFVEAWNEWNFLGLLVQMGVVAQDAMAVALAQAAVVKV